MKFAIATVAALLMVGTTFAQAPTKPAKPARPAMPAMPAMPAQSAERAPTDDEELALAAMEGLMAQAPERALPIIKKVLAGPQTRLVKQRALFVLSQIDSPGSAGDPGPDRSLIGCRPCAAKPFAASVLAAIQRPSTH